MDLLVLQAFTKAAAESERRRRIARSTAIGAATGASVGMAWPFAAMYLSRGLGVPSFRQVPATTLAGAGIGRLAATLRKEAKRDFHPVKVEAPKKKRKKFPFQGFVDFQGLKIDIENKKGSYREGKSPEGKKWRTYMHCAYGEIRGTEGSDGDKLDVYVGYNHDSPLVVVIHQQDPKTKKYDEDKVMIGFDTVATAIKAYKRQYDRPGFYQSHTTMQMGRFWRWVHDRSKHGKKVASRERRGRMSRELRDPRLYSNLRGAMALESAKKRVAAHKGLAKGDGTIRSAVRKGLLRERR